MFKVFSTLMLSSSLAISLLGVTPVKTLADTITEKNPCPGGALDCVIITQSGNCSVHTFYWRSRPTVVKKYCPVNNGKTNTNGSNGGTGISFPPCRVCDKPDTTINQ